MFALSYTTRVICVASIAMGTTHLFFHFLLRALLRIFMQMLDRHNARLQERFTFAIMLAPTLGALLLTFMLIVPAFVLHETDHRNEAAGIVCIFSAVAVWAWYAITPIRSARIIGKTFLFQRSMKAIGSTTVVSEQATSTTIVPTDKPLLAVVGLFHPRILLSKQLVDSSALAPEMLQVALRHERAHIFQHDNWKLLIASLVPQVPVLRLTSNASRPPSFYDLWRRYSEWAADDEATEGNAEQALLLADSLIFFARSSGGPLQGIIATGLSGHDRELTMRIQRLLSVKNHTTATNKLTGASYFSLFVLGFCLVTLSGAFAALPSLHSAVEYFLHLG
jgi:hypothetical protein